MRIFPFLFWLILAIMPATAGQYSKDDVLKAISTYGPRMIFRGSERYFMDDPEEFLPDPHLDNKLRCAIIPDPTSYTAFVRNKFYENIIDTKISSADIAGMNPRELCKKIADKKDFYYFLKFSTDQGNQKRARPLIQAVEGGSHLYLTFWFFYPFNGPGRAFVKALGSPKIDVKQDERGRHWGDWEHVTLRVTKKDKSLDLTGIFLSRHSFSPWYGDLKQFKMAEGTHPIVYIAENSHAHYPDTGDHIYDIRRVAASAGEIMTYDTTGDDRNSVIYDTFNSPDRQVFVASNIPGIEITQQGWWKFNQRWGQYIANRTKFGPIRAIENLIESAPTPPITKDPDYIHFIDDADSMAFGQAWSAEGNLEVFAVAEYADGTCCNLQHNILSDGKWSSWQENYAKATSVKAIVGRNFGANVDMFTIGEGDHVLKHNWLSGNGWQHTWQDIKSGAVRMAAFGVSSTVVAGKDVLHGELFAVRSSDGAMMHAWSASSNGNSWDRWTPNFLFPANVSFITTAATPSKALMVVALNEDGTPIYTTFKDSKWSDVEDIPNNASTVKLQAVSISSSEPLELLGVGTDQLLYHTTYENGRGWSGKWDVNFLGAPPYATFVSMVPGNNLEAFLVTEDGQIYQNYRDKSSGWHEWNRPGRFPPLDAFASRVLGFQQQAILLNRNLELFAITNGDTVSHTWLTRNEGWKSWELMFFDTSSEIKPN